MKGQKRQFFSIKSKNIQILDDHFNTNESKQLKHLSTFPTVTFKKGALMDPHVSRLQNHFYGSRQSVTQQEAKEDLRESRQLRLDLSLPS